MEKITINQKFKNCFVCSPTNPVGLHAVKTQVDGKAHMEITPHENMAGLNGTMHGGFSQMLLNEIMYEAVDLAGTDSVALTSTCNFKNSAVLGEKLIVKGWITKRDGRKFFTEGEIRKENGDIVATATGLYYEMDLSVFLPDEAE